VAASWTTRQRCHPAAPLLIGCTAGFGSRSRPVFSACPLRSRRSCRPLPYGCPKRVSVPTFPVGSDQGSHRCRAPSPTLVVPGRASNGPGIMRRRMRCHQLVPGDRTVRLTTTFPSVVVTSPSVGGSGFRVRRLPWATALILGDPQVGLASGVTGPLCPGHSSSRRWACAACCRDRCARHSEGGVCGSTRPAPKERSPSRPAEAAERPPSRGHPLGALPDRP
jgi:hypothetical protein